jgi:glycosyltransferase involved in cell wall biosynthesis
MSRVDVFIPCYKYAHFLRACVQSVLSQQGVDVRVLILDDASPDDTPAVGAELARDPRVEYRRHATNQRHIATYNEGIEWASGDYCLLLSADDMLTPGALQRAADLMDRHPEVGLTFGARAVLEGDALPAPREGASIETGWRVMSGWDFLQTVCATNENPVCTPTAVVRTSVQKRVGGYRAELPHTGDFEMWLRFAACSAVGVIDAEQAYWRLHRQNMRDQYQGLASLRQHKDAFDSFYREWGERLPDGQRLKRSFYHCLATAGFWHASASFDRGQTSVCDRELEFALELDPDLRLHKNWARLKYKRLVGARTWSLLRPAVSLLRKSARIASLGRHRPQPATVPVVGFDPDRWQA